ncbi:MAG: hypothetical protein IPM81_11090 [Saprospirales bacterium]|nr:hypothetical protein [Saprospirales bacterium]
MMHPTGQFPNETYLNGLRENPESTLAVVYDEFRAPIIRAVQLLGEPEETGAYAFQLAANDAVCLARTGKIPATIPFFIFLKALSLAHLREWQQAEGRAVSPAPGSPEEGRQELPGPEALRQTREKLYAWSCLQHLDPLCQQILTANPDAPAFPADNDGPESQSDCAAKYLQRLQTAETPLGALPDWAVAALRDAEGYAIWQRTQVLEQEWMAGGEPATPESNRIWRWAVAALLLAAVGYGAYQFYFRPKTAAEVFADNFVPPASLLQDMKTRYGAEMGNDSVSARPNECLRLLQEADAHYQAKDFQDAADPLLLIVLDSNSICQSDAWYFLGIIQLKLEDPATAIQCFAKIEDLGRYGEDLYWYQALAFVQLAKENPMMRDKARRAVERTLGNTRDPQRRARAEKMLQNLSK